MRVCVVGLGYIGLPTACAIAASGHRTQGVDTNSELVTELNHGVVRINNEPGLDELVTKVISEGYLKVGCHVEPAEVFVLAVPTPLLGLRGKATTGRSVKLLTPKADLTYLERAVKQVATVVQPGNLMVIESTVPPGTTSRIVPRWLSEVGIDPNSIHIAHAPERALPGNVLHELLHNDRIVGGVTSTATAVASAFYRTFVRGEVIGTDAVTAEAVKLVENTFRDVNIALANEFAVICEALGVDVWRAIEIANKHPRVNILRPGPGVGGYCLPKDPYFLAAAAPDRARLIYLARTINDSMPGYIVRLYDELVNGSMVQKVTILGVSYKPEVGDARGSPSLKIASLLTKRATHVELHDPYVPGYDKPLEHSLGGSEALLFLVGHSAYKRLDPTWVADVMRVRRVLDAANVVEERSWLEAGFEVRKLGSPAFGGTTRHRVQPTVI